MSAPTRPWYHRPEWIGVLITTATILLGAAGALSQGAAQTTTNTKDITELKLGLASVPERLARIEQKVDDLKAIEVREHKGSGE